MRTKQKANNADIATQKPSELKFRQLQVGWTTYLEKAPDGVFLSDVRGTFIYGNEKAEQITGYKREELVGSNYLTLHILPASYIAKALKLLALNLLGRSTGPDEFELIRKDGTRIVVEISTTPIKEHGKAIVIGFARDVTERIKVEQALKESEERYRGLMENSLIGVFLYQDNRYVYVNNVFAQMHGYTVEEIQRLDYLELMHPDDRESTVERTANRLKGIPFTAPIEKRRLTKDGQIFWAEVTGTTIEYKGKPAITGNLVNVTKRKQGEENLKSEAAKWQATFDAISDLVSVQDKDSKLVRVNKAYAAAFKMQPEELIGKHCYTLVHGTSCHIENCPHECTLKTKEAVTKEFFEPHLGIYLEVSTSPVFDQNGEIAGSVHIAKNITERKHLQQKLEDTATHDYLTGLPNRALLIDRFNIAAALAQRNKSTLAVMSLDIDKFKTINDTQGHGAGDQVLKIFSARISGIIRASDTIARIGGDEFILLMLETKRREDATTIAQKILDSFIEPLSINSHRLHISTSMGIAIFPDDAENLETLMKKSDAALYYSKGHGRNQFKFFADIRIGKDYKIDIPI